MVGEEEEEDIYKRSANMVSAENASPDELDIEQTRSMKS